MSERYEYLSDAWKSWVNLIYYSLWWRNISSNVVSLLVRRLLKESSAKENRRPDIVVPMPVICGYLSEHVMKDIAWYWCLNRASDLTFSHLIGRMYRYKSNELKKIKLKWSKAKTSVWRLRSQLTRWHVRHCLTFRVYLTGKIEAGCSYRTALWVIRKNVFLVCSRCT